MLSLCKSAKEHLLFARRRTELFTNGRPMLLLHWLLFAIECLLWQCSSDRSRRGYLRGSAESGESEPASAQINQVLARWV